MELDRCQDIEPGLARYALGLADDRVVMRVQIHLAEGCVGCARQLEELIVGFHMSALGGGAGEPPEDLEDKVLAAAASCQQERVEPVIVYPETSERKLLWTLLGLALVMVAAVAWWGSGERLQRASSESRAVVMAQAANRSVEELGTLQRIVTRATNPGTPIVDLQGLPGSDFELVSARLIYDLGSSEMWLRVVALPPAGEDQAYRLWLENSGPPQLVGSLLPQVFTLGGTSRFDLPEGLKKPFRLILRKQSHSDGGGAPAAGSVVLVAEVGEVHKASQPPQ